MTNEVREAAERLRSGASIHAIDDLTLVAVEFLQEHDPAPLDETWLRSVGFENFGGQSELTIFVRGSLIALFPDGEWQLNEWPMQLPPKTRGELRRLAASLAITLNEKGGG